MAINLPQGERDLFRIVAAIRQLILGRNNATGDITLTAGATTTVVTGPNISGDGGVWLFPQTANAAGAVATTYVKRTDLIRGQFTITHANAATVDRSFYWVCLGG